MKQKRGFTIVELVIVIAVIGILAAILIPSFSTIIKKSRLSSAQQNASNALRDYGAEYSATHQGDPLPNGMVAEANGYYFVYIDGALYEVSSGGKDNLSTLSACTSTFADKALARSYDIYEINAEDYPVVPAYLDSRSGSCAVTYYAGTTQRIDGEMVTADYVLRVETDDRVYLIGLYAQDLSGSQVYGGQILGTYAPNSAQGTFDPTNSAYIPAIKNIIYLIPDGAGFGTYDIANELKKRYGAGVYGQATPVTTDAIRGRTVTGLYLDEFMIASADTSMANAYGSATDSAAAGTALLCGTKTNYLMVGVDPDFHPVANVLELARLEGKSTGFVTTKCLVDATPSDGLSHSLKRADQDNSAYQLAVSEQILASDADVVLCYGSDGGYYAKANTQQAPLHNGRAADYGYTVVENLQQLNAAVDAGATRLFSKFQIDYQALNATGEYQLTSSNYYLTSCAYNTDYQALHVLYDCDAHAGVDLTLMDMAKAALTTLSTNINDQDGFCLVIEGGAIDNAAEGRNVREAVAEYLAFDEVFGYCVNWAMQRGDTIVVACPDHDSGGIYCPTLNNGAYTLDSLLEGLHDGTVPRNTKLAGARNGHTDQNVPAWLYAPKAVRASIIEALGLPADTDKTKVRTGQFYDGTVIDDAYSINNSDLVHAVIQAAGLHTLSWATSQLFVDATPYGTYDEGTMLFTFDNGATMQRNANRYTDPAGISHKAGGTAVYITNEAAYTTYDSVRTPYSTVGTVGQVFCVPRRVLVEMGYVTD